MPNMDGIEFLERLREKKPDVPVLIITGYPSIPNASAAMRLGACDYVTKPFTSEEITWAVQRVLSANDARPTATASPLWSTGRRAGGERASPRCSGTSPGCGWRSTDRRASARSSRGSAGRRSPRCRLPRIGEVVYQGLPLAGVTMSGKPTLIVPSPVSGVVMAVNEVMLAQRPGAAGERSVRRGLDCLHLHHAARGGVANCRHRRILLVNADAASAAEQARKLVGLGCLVEHVSDRDALLAALADGDGRAVFVDATSLGDSGPPLVEQVNRRAPHSRVVVMGAPGERGRDRLSEAQDLLLRRRAVFGQRDRRHPRRRVPDPRGRTARRPTQERPARADQRHLDHQSQLAQGAVAGRTGAVVGQRRAGSADSARSCSRGCFPSWSRPARPTSRRPTS